MAAGSVITHNVEPDSLAIARGRQEAKPGWAKRRRSLVTKKTKEPGKDGTRSET